MQVHQFNIPPALPLGKVVQSGLVVSVLGLLNFLAPLFLSEKLPSFVTPAGIITGFFGWLWERSSVLCIGYILLPLLVVCLSVHSVMLIEGNARYIKMGRFMIGALMVGKMLSVHTFVDKLFATTLAEVEPGFVVFLVYKHLVMMNVVPNLATIGVKFLKQYVHSYWIAGVVVVLAWTDLVMWMLALDIVSAVVTGLIVERVQTDTVNAFFEACSNIDISALEQWVDDVAKWLETPGELNIETVKEALRSARMTVHTTHTYVQLVKKTLCIGETWMNEYFNVFYCVIAGFYFFVALYYENVSFCAWGAIVAFIVWNMSQFQAHPVPEKATRFIIRASDVLATANNAFLLARIAQGGVSVAPAIGRGLVNVGVAVQEAVVGAGAWVSSWFR